MVNLQKYIIESILGWCEGTGSFNKRPVCGWHVKYLRKCWNMDVTEGLG